MSQSDSDKALAAEERSQETKSFVRRVRSITRRMYTFRREDPHRAGGLPPRGHRQTTCAGGRAASLTPTTPGRKSSWRRGREKLARDAVRDATQHEVKQLRRENAELKQLVGDLSLEVYRFKKTAIPIPYDDAGTSG